MTLEEMFKKRKELLALSVTTFHEYSNLSIQLEEICKHPRDKRVENHHSIECDLCGKHIRYKYIDETMLIDDVVKRIDSRLSQLTAAKELIKNTDNPTLVGLEARISEMEAFKLSLKKELHVRRYGK